MPYEASVAHAGPSAPGAETPARPGGRPGTGVATRKRAPGSRATRAIDRLRQRRQCQADARPRRRNARAASPSASIPHHAQCIVEDNPAAFAMDTHGMGGVVIPGHSFFMAMYAKEVALVAIRGDAEGKRVARLVGTLGCATEAGTGTVTIGSREATEPATFELEAVDGGPRAQTALPSRCSST